jgi:cytochrome P450 PksS
MVLLKDTERFANDKRNAGLQVSWLESRLSMGVVDSMVMKDGVDHRRLCTLAHKAFMPARVAALEHRIAQLADGLLDAADTRGTMDLMADLALPLPVAVISDMMGVDERYQHDFHRWMNGILELDGAGPLELLTNVPNMIKLNRFLRALIAERRKNKGDDLLSAMIEAEEAGDKLSFDELVASTLILLLAGHETTVNLIGSGVLALLEHPEQLERLRGHPELMDAAVEEMLRYTSPVQLNAPRFAREDTELCGVFLRKGAAVCPILGSANHDEAHFEDPERFDIGRQPNRHVAFGFGPHFCLGAPLARLEAKVVFRTLLRRYADIQLAVPRSELTWRRSQSVRGLTALPLRVRR